MAMRIFYKMGSPLRLRSRPICRCFATAVQQVAFHGQTPSKLFEGAEVIKQVGDRKMGLRCPNVDLRKNLEWSAADIKEIKEKLHAHRGVLTFPNQSTDLSPQDHINFAEHFGETEIHSAVKGIEGYPEVMQIEREPTADIIFGEDFHSDHSFQTWPASYSFLRATNEMTPYGTNNTQFANTIDAYADMPPLMKSVLAELMVSHSATKAYGEKNQGETGGGHKDNSLYAMKQTKGMELTGNAPIPDQHHPVVISHPLHGEPALFISKTFTNGIVGMTHNEGMELIMLLEKHITQDKYLFEVAHEENQITMWDNRQLVHKGLANDASRRRVIHRVSVSSGHIPVAAKEFDENGRDFEKALQAALKRKENGDVRLPAGLQKAELDQIFDSLLGATEMVKGSA
jgi:taurine dioxygenase